MPFILLCVVDPIEREKIDTYTYTIPNSSREELVRLSIRIGENQTLNSLGDTELSNEIFLYIRNLNTRISEQNSVLERGGKSFQSTKKPILFIVRYRSIGTQEEIMEDLIAIMTIESFSRARRSRDDPFAKAMMSMDGVAEEIKAMRTTNLRGGLKMMNLNVRGHDLDSETLAGFIKSSG
jgi:hypothetical protein